MMTGCRRRWFVGGIHGKCKNQNVSFVCVGGVLQATSWRWHGVRWKEPNGWSVLRCLEPQKVGLQG